ncbi:MAG: radical SAM protein, partial [bacterium]|nr:radical SAM protein [bacterium]
MSRINILFTTSAAPEKSPFFTTEKRPPLGVGFMISLLKNQGHTVFFIDNYLKPSRFIEEGYLQKNRIDYVGIYANTICYRDTLRMFNAIEQLRQKGVWQGKIIVGGPHTAVAPQTIPEFVDHIVLGEGEQAIQDILDGTTSDRIIRHPRLEDLDSLPFQPWDIFTALPYDFTCPWMDIQPVFTMNTSRGCMYTCNFCSASVIWERKYTCFSDERIIAEIEYLIREHQAKGIYFREDHFTLSNKRTQQFCQSLLDKSISISWACETRVDNLDEELIELMSKSGCRALYLGVESGSQRMLDVMKKGITVDQIKNVITWCHNFNIRTYCSLITGLPGETHEDYRLT